jgi:branched-subunit amino acid ABC-type transport system permease component
MSLAGYTQEQLKPHMWKMAISWIMPVLTAIGLALILKMARVDNLASGLIVSFEVWLFIVLSTRLYSYVYSPERPGLLVMDAIHLLLGTLAAGAIISAWP